MSLPATRPLSPSTVSESMALHLRGLADSEEAESFRKAVMVIVTEIGRYIDLDYLDGITIAGDYRAALAELNRGVDGAPVLSPNLDDVAQAVRVLREGLVRTHLVFDAASIRALATSSSSGRLWQEALYIVAHECAHVEQVGWEDQAFPGTIFKTPFADVMDATLRPSAMACWNEYAACRLSARFGLQRQNLFGDALIKAVSTSRERVRVAIRDYRDHDDMDRVMWDVRWPLTDPFLYASYYLGHLDGSRAGLADADEVRAAIAEHGYADAIDELHSILHGLWDSRGSWTTRAVFAPLLEMVARAFEEAGIQIELLDDGAAEVQIPLTPEA